MPKLPTAFQRLREKSCECEVSLGSIVQGQPQLCRDPISKTDHLQQLTHSSLQNHIYSFHVLFESPDWNTDKHQPTGGPSYRFRKESNLKIFYSRYNKNCNVFTLTGFPMPWMSRLVLYCIVNQPKESKSRARARMESRGTVLDSITSTTTNKRTNS